MICGLSFPQRASKRHTRCRCAMIPRSILRQWHRPTRGRVHALASAAMTAIDKSIIRVASGAAELD